jgi:hypothetical protein
MYTTTLHNPAIIVERFPVFTAVNEKKIRRYTLCLEMVQKVLLDFFPAKQPDTRLFQQLGEVACCIDTHLDDLDITQKKMLSDLFPSFFDSLGKNPDQYFFTERLQELCNKLGTTLYPPSWSATLFKFYTLCARYNLVSELKSFSVDIIQAAVLKSMAKNTKAVLKSLKQEGTASITFLLQLLQKEGLLQFEKNSSRKLSNYLGRLEKMLNIADDLCDSKKDKSKGTISVETGAFYHMALGSTLLKTFSTTVIKYPFLFLKHFAVFTYRYLRSELA